MGLAPVKAAIILVKPGLKPRAWSSPILAGKGQQAIWHHASDGHQVAGAAKCAGPLAGMAPRPPLRVFGGDAVLGVGVSLLGVKLRPSKHSFLLGGRITDADSVSEAFEKPT